MRYKQQKTEFDVIKNDINFWKGKKRCLPYILEGPPGNGKSTFVEDLAKELNCKYMELNGTPGLTREDVEGVPTLINGNSGWKNGVVPEAILEANRNGLCVLVINEYNIIRPEVQASTNSLLDYQGRFRLTTDANRLFQIEDGKTLVVVATFNSNLAGTFQIQGAVKTRIRKYIKLGYASKILESKIIVMVAGIQKNIADLVCEMAVELRRAATKADATIERAISTRELISFCEAIQIPDADLKVEFDYTIVNKLIEDEQDRKNIYVLVDEGRNFFTKLKALIHPEQIKVEKKVEVIKPIKQQMDEVSEAFPVERHRRYTVKELPTSILFDGKVYNVPERNKWAPLGETVAKFRKHQFYTSYYVHLYTRTPTGTRNIDECIWIRFYVSS